MTEIRGCRAYFLTQTTGTEKSPPPHFFYESCAEPIGMGFGRIMNFRENDGGNHFGKHT